MCLCVREKALECEFMCGTREEIRDGVLAPDQQQGDNNKVTRTTNRFVNCGRGFKFKSLLLWSASTQALAKAVEGRMAVVEARQGPNAQRGWKEAARRILSVMPRDEVIDSLLHQCEVAVAAKFTICRITRLKRAMFLLLCVFVLM